MKLLKISLFCWKDVQLNLVYIITNICLRIWRKIFYNEIKKRNINQLVKLAFQQTNPN